MQQWQQQLIQYKQQNEIRTEFQYRIPPGVTSLLVSANIQQQSLYQYTNSNMKLLLLVCTQQLSAIPQTLNLAASTKQSRSWYRKDSYDDDYDYDYDYDDDDDDYDYYGKRKDSYDYDYQQLYNNNDKNENNQQNENKDDDDNETLISGTGLTKEIDYTTAYLSLPHCTPDLLGYKNQLMNLEVKQTITTSQTGQPRWIYLVKSDKQKEVRVQLLVKQQRGGQVCNDLCRNQGVCDQSTGECNCNVKSLFYETTGRLCEVQSRRIRTNETQKQSLQPFSINYFYYSVQNNQQDYLLMIYKHNTGYLQLFINQQEYPDQLVYPATVVNNDFQTTMKASYIEVTVRGIYFQGEQQKRLYLTVQNSHSEYNYLEVMVVPQAYKQNTTQLSHTFDKQTALYVIYIVLIVSCVFICLSICLCPKFLARLRRRNAQVDELVLQRNQHRLERNGQRLIAENQSLSAEQMNKYLPDQKFKVLRQFIEEKSDQYNQHDCIVCLENMEQEDLCKITPCYHIYHSYCLQQWLKKHDNCPACRTSLQSQHLVPYGQLIPYVQRKVKRQAHLRSSAQSQPSNNYSYPHLSQL